MEWYGLIPEPDSIPAPWGVFETLDILTFVIHILIINVVVGGSLLALHSKLMGKHASLENTVAGTLVGKIPTAFALGVTFGVAPLLFLQVLYGHLIYSSSVLMAVFWILVIPALILGYYGTYIHKIKLLTSPVISWIALLVTSMCVLYIAFMFVNNMTLMLNPEEWGRYFTNRDGTLLNLGDPTVYARFFHFIVASVAVASLFSAIVWHFRRGRAESGDRIRSGLRIFGFASMIQVLVGVWLLLALPREVMLTFMGRNMLHTIFLTFGILAAIGVIILAMRGKLWPTVSLLVGTVVIMAMMRAFVRAVYVGRFFSVESLEVHPQYDVMALFAVTLVVGLGVIWYMIKLARAAHERRVTR